MLHIAFDILEPSNSTKARVLYLRMLKCLDLVKRVYFKLVCACLDLKDGIFGISRIKEDKLDSAL